MKSKNGRLVGLRGAHVNFILTLALVLIVFFFYQPHVGLDKFEIDDRHCYRVGLGRNTLWKMLDYRYSTGEYKFNRGFKPVHDFFWFLMASYYPHYSVSVEPYHLTIVILHTINVVLVFYVSKEFLKHPIPSFGVALSFGLYYLNFRAMDWVSAGTNHGIPTFFYLTAFYLFLRYVHTSKNRYYLLSLLAFTIGAYSKEAYFIFLTVVMTAYYILMRRTMILKPIKEDLLLAPFVIINLPMIYILAQLRESSAVVVWWGGFNFGMHMAYRFFDYLLFLITVGVISNSSKLLITALIFLLVPLLIHYSRRDKMTMFLLIWLVCSISMFIYSNFRSIYALGRYLYPTSIAWFTLLYYGVWSLRNRYLRVLAMMPLVYYTIIFNIFKILK